MILMQEGAIRNSVKAISVIDNRDRKRREMPGLADFRVQLPRDFADALPTPVAWPGTRSPLKRGSLWQGDVALTEFDRED